ncbi:MAG: hypothetical protein WAZ20_04955 [Methanothrix sp.]|nr:hypothetical protein [Methanothrix sp.]MDI9417886.1 hypothetical protein [Euryarchaeota archaeon]HON35867.1 hypothetical protein [Methanothrix sp.]HRU76660.1 hypothetical protein [Methanothrix sp.]
MIIKAPLSSISTSPLGVERRSGKTQPSGVVFLIAKPVSCAAAATG